MCSGLAERRPLLRAHRQLGRAWRCLFTEEAQPEPLEPGVEAEMNQGIWAEACRGGPGVGSSLGFGSWQALWSYLGNSTKLENLPVPLHCFLVKAQARQPGAHREGIRR